ncbi:MAG: hypothetical protein U9O24_00250 [Campylobacterota bacterium]|nr:hypothetical protein [Campylobacterota bacterium]
MFYKNSFFSLIFSTLIFYALIFSTLTFAETTTAKYKKYSVASGMITYTIDGGGILTEDVNLTINGKSKIRFKDWGMVELIEDEVEEITSGALNNIENINICIKRENNREFDVDFKNKKILERAVSKSRLTRKLTEGLVYSGQKMSIAGYRCNVWEGEGIKICIYEGLPLLVEHKMLEMYYQKKATTVKLDIKDNDEACTIPNFPLQKFSLFKTNIKLKNIQDTEGFSKVIDKISSKMHIYLKDKNISEENLTKKQKNVWLEKIGYSTYTKQKALLPKMLLGMQKTRECLAQAQNWIDANECLESMVDLKRQFTKDKERNIASWKERDRGKVLDVLDDKIINLKSKMPCIRSSKNLTDLSSCMK